MTHSFPTRRASELFAGPLHRGIAHVARIDDAVVQRRVDDIDAPAAGLHRRVGQGGLRLGRIAEGFADREHAGRRAAVALALGRPAGLRWMQSDAPAPTAAAEAAPRANGSAAG